MDDSLWCTTCPCWGGAEGGKQHQTSTALEAPGAGLAALRTLLSPGWHVVCEGWLLGLQVTTLQATRSKQAEVDPNGALAHKRKAGTLADIAEVSLLLWQRVDHQGRSACSAAACAGPDRLPALYTLVRRLL